MIKNIHSANHQLLIDNGKVEINNQSCVCVCVCVCEFLNPYPPTDPQHSSEKIKLLEISNRN